MTFGEYLVHCRTGKRTLGEHLIDCSIDRRT